MIRREVLAAVVACSLLVGDEPLTPQIWIIGEDTDLYVDSSDRMFLDLVVHAEMPQGTSGHLDVYLWNGTAWQPLATHPQIGGPMRRYRYRLAVTPPVYGPSWLLVELREANHRTPDTRLLSQDDMAIQWWPHSHM